MCTGCGVDKDSASLKEDTRGRTEIGQIQCVVRDVEAVSAVEPEHLEPGRVEDVAEILAFAEHDRDTRCKSSSEGVIQEQ